MWCQEYWCFFTEWHIPPFYQAREVDSVLQLIFSRKVNFLQVYNKLQVSRLFTGFSGTFTFLCVTTRPLLRSSQSTQWKVQLTRSISRVSYIFSSHFPACFQIVQCFLQDFLGSDLFTESWEKKHFRTLLILELVWIFICMHTACLQLVKVSTLHVFLGRDLLVQEDQYLFEICPAEHSAQNCHQIAISCVSSFLQATLQLVPARSLKIVLYLIVSDLIANIYKDQRCSEQTSQWKLPQAQLKRFKMNLANMKGLQP